MTVLRHKGYQGAVDFDPGRLLVRILHIDDFVATECDRASEAQGAFETLVDEYLETCKEVGKEPSRPFKGSFNVRVATDLHRKAALAAAAAGDSLNAWVAGAMTRRLEDEHRPRDVPAGAREIDRTHRPKRAQAGQGRGRHGRSPKPGSQGRSTPRATQVRAGGGRPALAPPPRSCYFLCGSGVVAGR